MSTKLIEALERAALDMGRAAAELAEAARAIATPIELECRTGFTRTPAWLYSSGKDNAADNAAGRVDVEFVQMGTDVIEYTDGFVELTVAIVVHGNGRVENANPERLRFKPCDG